MPYIIDSITAETINVNKTLVSSYYDNGDSSSNTNIDWSNGNLQELNLDNNPTLTFSNAPQGLTSTLLLKQQLGGLRTITWPNDVVWNGGSAPTLQTLPPAVNSGDVDSSFVYGTGFNNYSESINIQSDGKILIGGDFASYNGTAASRIIRLNTDGSVDGTFAYGSGFDNAVTSMTIQSDGKILVVGYFSSYNGTAANRIIRLNTDGSVDGTFAYGSGFNNAVMSMTIQSDGKILVGGYFITYNGTAANRIIRLNTDGSVDNTFVYGSGFNGGVISIDTQSDGKILVGGFFSSYNGTAANSIIRLNTDGSVDGTFVYGTGFDSGPNSIAIQPDGKILMGGFFTTYNGTAANRIIRLNTDGSVDGTFAYGSGFDSTIRVMTIQFDGKILIGGDFTSYNGTAANRIIRLNTDGSVDGTFAYGSGFDGSIRAITIQSDGKILVGGWFSSYNGTAANYIIRLISTSFSPLAYNTVEFDYNGTYYIGSY